MKDLKKISIWILLMLPVAFVVTGCATTSQKQLLESNDSQVKLRAIQTRAFDTTDKEKAMRTVISTLQDLDFVISDANFDIGTVTGNKFVSSNVLKISVTIRPRGETQLLIRANAQWGITAVEEPEQYQDFFTSLEKSMFLTANQVD